MGLCSTNCVTDDAKQLGSSIFSHVGPAAQLPMDYDTAPLLETGGSSVSDPRNFRNARNLWNGSDVREFVWNSKTCSGNALHMAIAEGDREEVLRILRSTSNPQDLCRAPFSCQTAMSPQFSGGLSPVSSHIQLTGEAIHVAASGGHLEILKDLLAHRASLEAPVLKDGVTYCGVLHAALLGEGPGLEDVVKFLLSNTELTCTAAGKHPLHFAAIAGNPSLICLVRHFMKKQGMTEADIPGGTVPSTDLNSVELQAPLTLAIRMATMKMKDLVLSAEPSSYSLKLFMKDCPEAVPLFLQRMKNLGILKDVLYHANLTSLDVAAVLRESVSAAESILECATTRPLCDEEHYPLPTNVSFAARNYEQAVWNMLNRGMWSVEVFTTLESWDEWHYRGSNSAWHQTLTNTKFGRPIRAPEIRVCHIPDLISPELFVALANTDTDCKIFDNRLVAFLVAHVFENHAGPAEFIRCLVNLWILILLNLHTWYLHEPESMQSGVIWVSVRFLAAESVVEIIWEGVQLFGYVSIGQAHDYLRFENLNDFFWAVIPTYLWYDPQCDVVMLLTIFLYWGRILLFASFCEPIGRTLQPFTKILQNLGPVLFITMIAFAAFSHAFFSLKRSSFDDSLYGSFVTLIAAGLPSEPSHNELQAILLYVSVTFFTVFILNIFIGVIGEEYSRLKEECDLGFKQLRAKMCLEYILRKHFFRIHICSKTMSKVVCFTALSVGLTIQFISVCNYKHNYAALEGASYVFLLCLMHGAFYNSPGSHKLVAPEAGDPSYFWYCCEAEREVVEEADLREIELNIETRHDL
eukprot:s3038_g19.t1